MFNDPLTKLYDRVVTENTQGFNPKANKIGDLSQSKFTPLTQKVNELYANGHGVRDFDELYNLIETGIKELEIYDSQKIKSLTQLGEIKETKEWLIEQGKDPVLELVKFLNNTTMKGINLGADKFKHKERY